MYCVHMYLYIDICIQTFVDQPSFCSSFQPSGEKLLKKPPVVTDMA